MELTVVLPLYNEAEQLPHTLAALRPILKGCTSSYEILCVDDGSQDQTWAIFCAEAAADPHLKGLRFSRNFGKEAALCAALDTAQGDAVLLMDADLQHPPSYIPQFLELHRQGYQVIDGLKSDRGNESKLSRFLATRFYHLFFRLTGVNLENASDFKLLDRQVVEAWKQLQERTTFFRGLVQWLGFKHTTLSFAVEDRQHGSSKWTRSSLLRLAFQAITSFTAKPLRLVTLLGFLFLLIACVLGVQTLLLWLRGQALGGFPTVILLQLLIGGFTLISLGLIGLYLGQIYEEIKGRPRYLIQERIGESAEQIN